MCVTFNLRSTSHRQLRHSALATNRSSLLLAPSLSHRDNHPYDAVCLSSSDRCSSALFICLLYFRQDCFLVACLSICFGILLWLLTPILPTFGKQEIAESRNARKRVCRRRCSEFHFLHHNRAAPNDGIDVCAFYMPT